jgi:N-formylglutamate deformylase
MDRTSKDGKPDALVILRPAENALPIVFDSPHSGSFYPSDFAAVVPISALREFEDRHVGELFSPVVEHGSTLIEAQYARTYIDLNRTLDDLDEALLEDRWPSTLDPGAASKRGVGLVWGRIGADRPIHERLLRRAEVELRIAQGWQPYHDVLQRTLDDLHRLHGAVWHINCHSMWSVGRALSPDPGRRRADFVVSDLDGRSCDSAFTKFVQSTLEGLGYSVAINDPFKGGAIVARQGDPARRRHSLQIEVSRSLYMDEATLQRHDGFARLQRDPRGTRAPAGQQGSLLA